MATVQQTQPNIQMLLATSDYVGALDLITATQDILTRDLAGIHSFRYRWRETGVCVCGLITSCLSTHIVLFVLTLLFMHTEGCTSSLYFLVHTNFYCVDRDTFCP